MVRSIRSLAIALSLASTALVGCAVQTASSDQVTVDSNAQTMKADGQKPMLQVVVDHCNNGQPQPWDGNPCNPSTPSASGGQGAGDNVAPSPQTSPSTLVGQKTPLTPIPTR